MDKFDFLITVLSWEERFALGLEHDLEQKKIGKVIIICFQESLSKNADNYATAKALCQKQNVAIVEIFISHLDPVGSWKTLRRDLNEKLGDSKSVLLDITTMPREIIWTILSFLMAQKSTIEYVYHKPDGYDDVWLSREPGEPRLLFKHSGITRLGLPTALVIITGFDTDRTRQLVNFFEPKITILGIQEGNEYGNKSRNNKEQHINECKGQTEFLDFELDVYSNDNGYNAIKGNIDKLKNYNVIVSSQGPKLSAIALYKIFKENEYIGFCYVPCKEYNRNYSKGLKESIFGSFLEDS